MKKICIFSIIFLSISVSLSGKSYNSNTKIWGYVLHSSKLSKKYLKNKIRELDIISITGYILTKHGNLKYKENKLLNIIQKEAKNTSIKIYPLISFKSASAGHFVLNSKNLRKYSIINIKKLVNKYEFDGIHLDFEYLPPEDSVMLAKFLKNLNITLKNIKITMAIFPQVDFPEKLSNFHDLKVLSPFIDEIVLMCYDYHRQGTTPGPVTDYYWAEKNIIESLKYLRSEQIWLGIPSYGYRWSETGKTTALSAKYGIMIAKKHGYKRHSSGNIFFTYSDSYNKYTVFISDKVMRIRLKKLVSKHSLKGVAIWRLGFED